MRFATRLRYLTAPSSFLATLVLLATPTLAGDSWPNWRGPDSNGVVSGNYPTSWSTEENVLWVKDLPAHGGSTPIVWGDQIFLTSNHDGKNFARCYNWQGEMLWEVDLGAEVAGKHRKASGCNPSPVTDGKHLFVYFKSGDLACLDFQGNVIWQRNLQKDFAEDTLWWDLGTSPVLTKNHLVVACMQSGPSYLAAFEKQSGELAWKTDRMLDAPEEANQSYSTPSVVSHDGQEIIVSLGADHVTAHDAASGKERWRVGGFNPEQNGYFRSIASQVVSNDVIVAPYARGKTLTGLSLDGKIIWEHDEISSDVPTPAAIDGNVFLLNDKGTLACLDAKTGKEKWSVDTGRNRNAFSASPILAGDYLYVAREDGTIFVVRANGDHELVSTNEMNDFLVATPVFVNGRILIRTSGHLYCIGNENRAG